jgi:carbonic anhydrase/acetyltransferase-like protein (isoleucine patch superfamily)
MIRFSKIRIGEQFRIDKRISIKTPKFKCNKIWCNNVTINEKYNCAGSSIKDDTLVELISECSRCIFKENCTVNNSADIPYSSEPMSCPNFEFDEDEQFIGA